MKAKIKDLTMNLDGTVNLTLQTGTEAKLLAVQMPAGTAVDVDIKPHREKRSLSANAYAWVLIDKLAEVLCISRNEVYRHAIRDIPGTHDSIMIQRALVPKFAAAWESHGIGWQVKTDASFNALTEFAHVDVYYGSSVFDTAQMSILIDTLIAECHAQGIETLPQAHIERMMNLYETRRGK